MSTSFIPLSMGEALGDSATILGGPGEPPMGGKLPEYLNVSGIAEIPYTPQEVSPPKAEITDLVTSAPKPMNFG